MKNNTSSRFHSSIVVSQTFQRHTIGHHLLAVYGVSRLSKKYFTVMCFACIFLLLLGSCAINRQIGKQAKSILLTDSIIATGHVGICIYEPATGKYLFNYEATKHFVPASNVKIFSLYAGLKYLGDSLEGLRYRQTDTALIIYPTGDPTFLHPDFKQQPVYDFLNTKTAITYATQHFAAPLGAGWSWDDYNDTYMVQRSEFPLYGNLTTFTVANNMVTSIPKNITVSLVNLPLNPNGKPDSSGYNAYRIWGSNNYTLTQTAGGPAREKYEIPFVAGLPQLTVFLGDTLHQTIRAFDAFSATTKLQNPITAIIHSRPADSMFKPMMHNSDNFFAEQILLMASQAHLGYMNTEAIIDTLLKTDLKDIPQKPRWVDGSGLSRYNLFTPQSLVYILNKMQKEFGIKRLKGILPTGGSGTFKNYFQKDSGYIYAKTGSLGNHIGLSGYLYTKQGRLLVFSILNNHFIGSATHVRRSVEKFLEGIRERY